MADDRPNLSELQAYDAMCEFLEAYWVARGKLDEDIASLLGGMNRELFTDGGPLDPAMWAAWKSAIDRALARNRPSGDFLDRMPK